MGRSGAPSKGNHRNLIVTHRVAEVELPVDFYGDPLNMKWYDGTQRTPPGPDHHRRTHRRTHCLLPPQLPGPVERQFLGHGMMTGVPIATFLFPLLAANPRPLETRSLALGELG